MPAQNCFSVFASNGPPKSGLFLEKYSHVFACLFLCHLDGKCDIECLSNLPKIGVGVAKK